MDPYPFSTEEWEACLKVLEALQTDPLNNPDNQRFKTLISSIRKKARKNIQKNLDDYLTSSKNNEDSDLEILKKSVIVQQALENRTLYSHTEEETSFSTIQKPQLCYCCHQPYHDIHFFYHKLCPTCADENYKNRSLTYDLSGQTVIITGGRVKIGYAATLQFLRSGAKVIATSRFPALGFEQFRKEKDYEQWKDRLFLYGLDLRNIRSVHEFTEYCYQNFESIEILVNNAAQTIKYPADYYQPLLAKEQLLLSSYAENRNLIGNGTPISNDKSEFLPLSHENFDVAPANRFGQPKDLRDKNSWNSLMDEIGTEELLEVNLINHISPYLLISALKPLMKKSHSERRHIINVTSTEGQFSYKSKNEFHPHTNMTKAALNMLTKTSAPDFVKDNIFMNAVDVGWISTGAAESKREKLFEKTRIPPLDSVDGAMRIFHPIMQINKGDLNLYGKLLKNYKETGW
ncbi:oxidoreductase [Chryseobacterium shigense]|uniref:NAD(P)-dependent dehydrogenase, short-chain alcohol dehydrogenase family n=1 Tax=Chryseobacterium shigense TaxID=297244 RepID=A0A1N7JFI0_9FLAO|nr:SDR family oxidoreductase [Chryseobacterium shigense]PQA96695.1 oxidoreductase [Chryseobacterium shigense]SIS48011.1 NAD(P)-dependent dehydrogenase, short-chain alcohol dehydrogenase family [Chryseobacterium shigense]